MSVLPDGEHQPPACGACCGDTRFDGDDFVCDDCQLVFTPDSLQASFLDPDAQTCGAKCDNYWHGDNEIQVGMGYRCGTCALPAGHESLHWTGCQSVTLVAAKRGAGHP